MMTRNATCTAFDEELALLAGGDFDCDSEHGVRLHLTTCPACPVFLASLQADQAALAGLVEPDELGASLRPAILARLATEAHEAASRRPVSPRRRWWDAGLGGFARAAAALAIVVSAAYLGLTVLERGGGMAPAGTGGQGDVASNATSQELRVRRAAAGVELSWAGDGRELGRDGQVETYRVLASANPRDFSAAQPVEVAGRRLVAELPLPAAKAADRKVTYFRVE